MAPKSRRSPRKEEPTAPVGWFRRWLLRLFLASLVVAVVGVAVLFGLYRHHVIEHPGEHMAKDRILQLISQESPVYYRDGVTKLGVFFAEEHRQYTPFEQIPEDFVHALVSSEDQGFFEHGGFSISGISRAFVKNLQAGRTVAGGSTLTQQTAKNLFKRRGRTYREKLRELVNALRLEAHYSKEEILEFYSNQFYVNGNGRGLAIAARFFFDRELSELSLVECAFLAGVVKSPNRYNPWVAGEERRTRALEAATTRTHYVLGRMLAEGRVDTARYAEAMTQPIPFERGHFRFDRSVILDEVERVLSGPHFSELLAQHGVAELGTSGLRVTTTLDAGIQEGAVYSLRHHLTEVGSWLETLPLEEAFQPGASLRPVDPELLRPSTFHQAVLLSVDAGLRTATLDLGGVIGTVDAAGNERLAGARKRGRKKTPWATVSRAEVSTFVRGLKSFVGQTTVVSVREVLDGKLVLDWEIEPQLQGAVVVLDQGEVRAMVGGARNADFNRAVMAKRQLGSTWKLLLFEAALQLRWSSTDRLANARDFFPYQGWFYYPRPDHKDAAETVSLVWAATKSENLASIWLLYHLTDRLNAEQFRQVAGRVGLLPAENESRKDYILRVQKAGVVATQARLEAGLFERVAEELAVDLVFDGRDRDADLVRYLDLGHGIAGEREKLKVDDEIENDERAIRSRLLDRNFRRQELLAAAFDMKRAQLMGKIAASEPLVAEDLRGLFLLSPAVDPPGPSAALTAEGGLADNRSDGAVETPGAEPPIPDRPILVFSDQEDEQRLPLDEVLFERLVEWAGVVGEGDAGMGADPAQPEEPDEADLLFGGELPEVGEDPQPGLGADAPPAKGDPTAAVARLLHPGHVRLDGLLTPSLVTRLRAALDDALDELEVGLDLYSLPNLALCRDFRVLVGLRYLQQLARASGVKSEVAPVLSLPLGSSELTLMEAAQLYQVMLTGATYQFGPETTGAGEDAAVDEGMAMEPSGTPTDEEHPTSPGELDVSLIGEVRLPDGEVIYRARRERVPLQSERVAGELGNMLRSVVKHGTGRRAEGRVRAYSADPQRQAELENLGVRVPLFGKTGTTNAYRNSAFIGQVAGLAEGGDRLSWGQGHVVATYVGYDDNREMKRGAIRVAGASGSLPVWIGTSAAVVRASDIGDRVDLADLAFSGERILPLEWPPEFVPITVDLRAGLPASVDGDKTTVLYQRKEARSFSPFVAVVEN